MPALDYALYTELAVGSGHPSLADVINRPLKSVLVASGLATTVDPFPGFLPLAGGTRTISSLVMTDSLTLGAASNITVNTDKFTVDAATGNTLVAGTLALTGNLAIGTNRFTVNASTGATVVYGAFGCNGQAAQTAVASGGALAAYVTGANGLSTSGAMSALHAMVVSIRAALVANGIMS
jgi:hypothetical protein